VTCGVSTNDNDIHFSSPLQESLAVLRRADSGGSAFFRS